MTARRTIVRPRAQGPEVPTPSAPAAGPREPSEPSRAGSGVSRDGRAQRTPGPRNAGAPGLRHTAGWPASYFPDAGGRRHGQQKRGLAPGPAGVAPRPGKQEPRCAWSRATWGARVARAGRGLLGPWRQNISPGTCPISPDLRSRVTDLVITWFADLLGTPAAEGFSLPPPPSPAALSKDTAPPRPSSLPALQALPSPS